VNTLGLQLGAPVTKALVQAPCSLVRDAEAEADLAVAAPAGEALGCARQLGGDAPSTEALGYEDVLDLGNAECRVAPRDVRVSDREVALPRDEIRLDAVETRQWETSVDELDVGVC
jgi:hypothetical protein